MMRPEALNRDEPMTEDQFAEALCQLVGEAEDAGLELPQIITVLVEQIEAMRAELAE